MPNDGVSWTSNALSEMVGIVKLPPDAKVPVAPAGFVAPNAADYRGFRPKRAELAVAPDVVKEIESFADYRTVFGQTAPPAEHVAQALSAAGKWSALLAATTEWMTYVKSQEGMAWKDALTLTDKLKAPLALASAHDPTLAARYPGLTRMLGAAKVIARRGVSTRQRNAKGAGGGGGRGSGAAHAASPPPGGASAVSAPSAGSARTSFTPTG